MKNCKTLPQNLFIKAVLLLFVSMGLFTTVQDAPASIAQITITSDAGSDDTYKAGDTIQATVKFNGGVNINTKNGTPYLTLKIGTAGKNAAYTSGTGTTALVFAYTVAAGDTDTDGIEIEANKLSLNSGTITDVDTGKATDLKHAALNAQASHKVDTIVPKIPINPNGHSNIRMNSKVNPYRIGEVFRTTVGFTENVVVTGTPQLKLRIGTAIKQANYASGSGSATLVFEYTVAVGDTDADGVNITTDSLTLNNGTITDAAGNNADLRHRPASGGPTRRIDGIRPEIAANGVAFTSTTAPYKTGEVIQATVTFSENLSVIGTPQLTLQIGSVTKTADYASGSGTAALVFAYTVAAGDTDADGISIGANALSLNGGTIKDGIGNAATLTHTAVSADSAHKVDTQNPSISEINITSTGPYIAGEVIQTTVTFNEGVIVTGTPQLSLQIGSVTKTADYASGSGTTALVFEYTVVVGDTDADGVSIDADALSLNSGTIKDATGNAATLTHTAVSADSAHKVDTVKPSVNSIAFTSTTAPYMEREVIQATVTFSENVVVTGTPQLSLQIGSATRTANYASGSGTAALVFAYTVVAGDTDANGISIGANALSLNSGTIKDAAGNAATLTHTTGFDDSNHKVDAIAPSINSIAFTSTTAPYMAGEVIQTTVTFSENVIVIGTPQLSLQIGSATKNADYASGNSSTALVFEYTVVAGDMDAGGISIAADALSWNGGIIKDAPGNPATLTHAAVSDDSAHQVDTQNPSINNIAFISGEGPYRAGEVIQTTVTFNEGVIVTGTPQLTLQIGSATKTADYQRDDANGKLLFEYAVVVGDTDANGVSIGANALSLNGGTIKDAAENAATLTHTTVSDNASYKVDTTSPEIISNGVAFSSTTAHYTTDEVIQATVTFSENVIVTGRPQLTLQIGSATKAADYASGSGTAALVFAYTVAAGDTDADGISIGANALSLYSGTIKDAAGNAATLTHTAVSADSAHQVDTKNPSINNIAFTSTTAPYTVGEVVQTTVTFDERVFVTGTPQLKLQFKGTKKPAVYKSGSGTTALVFAYTVVAGDTDEDGISIDADALALNGGTIKDAVGNNANLTHTAILAQTAHVVDTEKPRINALRITSTPTNNTYKAGDSINVTVDWSKAVDVTGSPTIALSMEREIRTLSYKSGSGSKALVFSYTVTAGDTDETGISIAAGQIELGNGVKIIQKGAATAAILSHSGLSDDASHKVDTTVPEIVASNGIAFTSTTAPYTAGEVVQATVTFSDNVIVTGTPQLALQVGSATRNAVYKSGSGTTALLFEYTVVAADAEADGISINADALSLNGGTIGDTAGNAATLTHTALPAQASHKVDATAPTIATNGISITSTATSNNIYTKGDAIQITVTFSENVDVTGTPQLTLRLGTADKNAAWTSGSGTTALVFEYIVVASDVDADGIEIEANKLTLNGGTIKDAAGNAATLTYNALLAQASHKVDGTIPAINSIAITSTAPANNTYKTGDKIQATVTFTEKMKVTGTPQLKLQIGGATKNAGYASGTGAAALVFEYTVAAGDTDADGISIGANALSLNSGTITDTTGSAAVLTHTAVPDNSAHQVDSTQPNIVSNGVAITSTTAPYIVGEVIQATVTFSEDVFVTGTPQLTLQIGSARKTASYASGTGTAALVFTYTVATGDADADGFSIPANALSLNNGTIKDTAGNAAVLTHRAVSDDSSHKVDGIQPNIVSNGIAIASTAPSNNIYTAGDTIQATVTFSENVDVTGTPQLTLKIGTAGKNAAWTSGSGTTALVFEYTVVAGDVDTDGISIEADKLTLNSGTIKDAAENAAVLTHAAVSDASSHQVDGIQPNIVSNGIAITSTTAPYMESEVIQATVTFSEDVRVTGTPQLALQIGSATKNADYASGSSSTALVFEYTVVAGDTDADGFSIGANALSLNGGTIKDAAGNNAGLTHTGVPASMSYKVDAVEPTLSSIQISSSAGNDVTYMLGNVIQISMTMSEVVNVTGAPKLTLTIGTENRLADYQSGDGTATLEFTYTVVAGDTDTDGVSIPEVPLNLNGAVITDTVGNPLRALNQLPLTNQMAHKVDTDPPKIVSSSSDDQGPSGAVGFSRALNAAVVSNGVEITSSGPYGTGGVVQIAVMFSERVRVTGEPEIELQISGTTKKARYHSGSSTDKITFRYIVASGDSDADGISIRADSIQLNGGSITDIPGNPADLKHSEVSANPQHRVDTTLFKISSLAFSSTGPYKTSDTIEVTVTTTKRVTVTGDVTLKVMVGNTEKPARYHSGSGTNRLAFRYTVTAGDNDTNGISVSLNSLSRNGGTIRDELGRNLDLNHDTLPDAGDVHRVDTTPPRVSSVVFTSTGPYGVGNDIEITVTTSEAVEVIGTPTLGMTIGTTQRAARFFGGTRTDRLVFRYKVTAADEDDTNGASVNHNSLSRNSGTITDAVGNALNLSHSGITNAGDTQIVRTTVPSILSLAFTSTGPYGISDRIQVTVTTMKPVTVIGSATLKVLIGHTERSVQYHSGSGTNRLTFQYTVASGDGDDTDGVSVRANSLSLNGGTIVDAFGIALNLNHDALPDGGDSQRVDTTLPEVVSLAFTSTGPYSASDKIEVTLTTNEAVEVTGNPTLGMTIGTTQRAARLFSGTGTSTLVFRYEVIVTDEDDTDGVSVRANSLSLNGGTIEDKSGTALNLNHNALPDGGDSQRVNPISPQVRHIAFTSTGPYGISDNIEVTVTTTKSMIVTGSATLKVLIGHTEKSGRYHSGSGTNRLVFQYTVTSNDGDDTNGVSVRANSLSLNGGTIVDELGTALNLNHDALPDAGERQRVDTTLPQVSSVAFTSTGPYSVGSDILVTVTTGEAVIVAGRPTLTIVIGSTERTAHFLNSNSTTTLVFGYRITAADKDDTNGVSVKANSLTLNGGTITDSVGNDLNLNHSGVANAGDTQIVGTTVSDIRSIAFTSTGPYAIDDTITVTVEATETVTVTGIPRIPMTLGTATKYANYVSGSETTSLVFQYTVVRGDEDADGVEIAPNALENHNGSQIENRYRTALNLNHPSVAADPKHKVDTTKPEILEVAFPTDSPTIYTAGSTLEVIVTFEESGVKVNPGANGDMPSLGLLFGSNSASLYQKTAVEARYTETRPGSTKLVFTYTITSDTPIDTDGVQIEARSLRLPAGATITDAVGNPIQSISGPDGSAIVNIRPSSRISSPPILPAITSAGIIFNEFLNANTDKEDWVELRNITDGEISLGGWELNLSSTLSKGMDTFEFPEMTLPAGTVLLLVNTGHKETRLEHSQAYTYRYLSVPELHLPASNFSLMLRDRSKAIADVVGTYFSDAGAANTATQFEQNEAYFREQPSIPGYEAAAWRQSGYQAGLGYDRTAPTETSLGTPGYAKETLTVPAEPVGLVGISEIMFTPGQSGTLPQWIELYNSSKTNVVSLSGWRFQFEGHDPDSQPVQSFLTIPIQGTLQILPNQTVLIVTKNGRSSKHFPEPRVYNLSKQAPDKLEQLGTDAQLIKAVGFAIVLRDDRGNQIDIVGNLDGENKTRDAPKWKLPNCITPDGNRTSIIRQYEENTPLKGTWKSSWFRASSIRQKISTYWGNADDAGNPGYKKGGPLPVQLSSFSAERTEQGALIKWTTQSELENAGFNVLRSDTRTGTFKVVNSRMLQGAGTTSERHTYQYVDTTAKAGVAYHYRLEEVSFAGVRQPVATRRLRGHVSAANRYLTTFGSIKRTE